MRALETVGILLGIIVAVIVVIVLLKYLVDKTSSALSKIVEEENSNMENIFEYRANRFLHKPITVKEQTTKTKIEPTVILKEEKVKEFVTITKCAYCDCVDSYVKGVCIHCGGSQQIRVKEEIRRNEI